MYGQDWCYEFSVLKHLKEPKACKDPENLGKNSGVQTIPLFEVNAFWIILPLNDTFWEGL